MHTLRKHKTIHFYLPFFLYRNKIDRKSTTKIIKIYADNVINIVSNFWFKSYRHLNVNTIINKSIVECRLKTMWNVILSTFNEILLPRVCFWNFFETLSFIYCDDFCISTVQSTNSTYSTPMVVIKRLCLPRACNNTSTYRVRNFHHIKSSLIISAQQQNN